MKKDLHIINELEELNSSLASLSFEKKIKIEKAYFDKLVENVFSELQKQNIVEENLNDYFEQMQNKVISEIQPKSKVLKLSIINRIAAIFILAIASWFLINQSIQTEVTQESSFVEALEEDEIIYLLEEYASTEELASLASESENSNTLSEDTEEILEYLDESDIIEQLEL